jgi:hypothetical protein
MQADTVLAPLRARHDDLGTFGNVPGCAEIGFSHVRATQDDVIFDGYTSH